MGKISKSNIKYDDNRKSNINDSHVHDNIDVSGVGHTVKVSKSESIILPNEESYLNELIRWFGRWLIGKKKNIGLPIIAIPSLASLYVVIDWIQFHFIEGLNNNIKLWVRVFSIFWLIIVFGLYIMLKRDVCPQCKKLLAMRTIKREQLGKGKYQGNIIHNIKETYRCDYCNYTFSEIVPEKE